jgi:hypothetical protein
MKALTDQQLIIGHRYHVMTEDSTTGDDISFTGTVAIREEVDYTSVVYTFTDVTSVRLYHIPQEDDDYIPDAGTWFNEGEEED